MFASAVAGEQWGTITSEPGSGGDIARTRSVASPLDAEPFLVGRSYGVTGAKHFGSGLGITDRMMTTAIPEGETEPTIFVLDVRDRPWDGSAGLELVAEWDGMGMAATQSHAMKLVGAPAVRLAWDGGLDAITRAASPAVATLFTAVILGVLDEAVAVAREQVRDRADQLRAYERVEWSRAEQDHWLAVQAYEGALRGVESGQPAVAFHGALRAKEAVADLSEQTLLRLTRPRRRDLLPTIAVRPLVRRRPRARLPPAPVGARVRHPLLVVDRVADRSRVCVRSARGAVDGPADPGVGAAAAHVLDGVDVGVGRVRVRGEQRGGGHDLAGLAEAALRDVLVDPRLLHRVQRVAVGEALDRRDGVSGALARPA